jgi:hypothetical protein
VPKGSSARIVFDLDPGASIGLAGLLQGKGDIAEWTPATGIEKVCPGGFDRIRSNVHRAVIACTVMKRNPEFRGFRARTHLIRFYKGGLLSVRFAPKATELLLRSEMSRRARSRRQSLRFEMAV